MSFALLSLLNGMRHVVMKRDIKNRNGNRCLCRIMGFMQEVILEGVNRDPGILIDYGASDALSNGTRRLYIKLKNLHLIHGVQVIPSPTQRKLSPSSPHTRLLHGMQMTRSTTRRKKFSPLSPQKQVKPEWQVMLSSSQRKLSPLFSHRPKVQEISSQRKLSPSSPPMRIMTEAQVTPSQRKLSPSYPHMRIMADVRETPSHRKLSPSSSHMQIMAAGQVSPSQKKLSSPTHIQLLPEVQVTPSMSRRKLFPSSPYMLQPKKLIEMDIEEPQNDMVIINLEGIEQFTTGIPNLLSNESSDSVDNMVYRPITGIFSPPSLLNEAQITVAANNSPPPLVRIGTYLSLEQPTIPQTSTRPPAATQLKKTRLYCNKPNACKFCGEKRTNIKRHMLSVHQEKPEVREYLSLPEHHPKKKNLLSQIRRDGNFYAFQKEDLLLSRIQSGDVKLKDYLACACCKKILKKQSLRKHLKTCTAKTTQPTRSVRISSLAISERIHAAAVDAVKYFIFPCLRNGPTKEAIRFDKLLILYANDLCMKYRSQHHYAMIRNRVSTLANVLIKIREIDKNVTEMEDIMIPSQFENIMTVLNVLGQYNSTTGNYEKPTLPTTVGSSLRYVIRLHITECIKDCCENDKKQARDLLELINTLLPARVNKTATESLLKNKRRKAVIMPTIEDIKKFTEYVDSNRDRYLEILKTDFNREAWLSLSKYTLISILIFNRRRPGELQRAEISDLRSLHEMEKSDELLSELTQEERQRVTQYVRFVVRGKLARGVPVLLHKSMYQCINMILKYRPEAGVPKDNPYIFGLPQTEKSAVFRHLIATDLMRTFSSECGAKYPKSLRATNLRKHVATHSMTMNLNNDDIENLQNYMGHADKIHKEYYRQPIIHKDILNMSKVLVAAQGGNSTVDNISHSHVASENICSSISGINCPSTSGIKSTYASSSKHSSTNKRPADVVPFILENINSSDSDSDYICSISSQDEDEDLLDTPKRRRLFAGKRGIATSKRTWTTPERHAIRRIFSTNFENKSTPSHDEIRQATISCPDLNQRTIPQIRIWISNELQSLKNPLKRRSWSTPAKHALKEAFGGYICGSHKGYPSTDYIQSKISQFVELKEKTPKKIRSQIQHLKKKFQII